MEATILVRSIFETFAQMRYFQLRPSEWRNHMMGGFSGILSSRVKFTKIFNTLSTGFSVKQYTQLYGLLSGVSHGGLAQSTFRVICEKNGASAQLGSKYSDMRASFVMNQLVPLAYGYLKFFNLAFPENSLSADSVSFLKYEKSLKWLDSYLESDLRELPEKNHQSAMFHLRRIALKTSKIKGKKR